MKFSKYNSQRLILFMVTFLNWNFYLQVTDALQRTPIAQPAS